MSHKLALKQVVLCGRRRALGTFKNIRQAAEDMVERDEDLLDLSDFGFIPRCDDYEGDDYEGADYDRAIDKAVNYYIRNIDEVASYDNRRGLIYVYESKKGNYFVATSQDNKDLKKVKPNDKGNLVVRVSKEGCDYNLNIKV